MKIAVLSTLKWGFDYHKKTASVPGCGSGFARGVKCQKSLNVDKTGEDGKALNSRGNILRNLAKRGGVVRSAYEKLK